MCQTTSDCASRFSVGRWFSRHNKPSFLTPRSDDRPRSAVLFAGTCPSRTAVVLIFILQSFAASVFATGHGFQGAALESAIFAQE